MSIWGKGYDDKEDAFNAAVESIEAKYIDVFKNKTNSVTGKAPDRLAYQFLTTYDGQRHTCGFKKDTYVPVNIQNEVYDTFRSIFSDK